MFLFFFFYPMILYQLTFSQAVKEPQNAGLQLDGRGEVYSPFNFISVI